MSVSERGLGAFTRLYCKDESVGRGLLGTSRKRLAEPEALAVSSIASFIELILF